MIQTLQAIHRFLDVSRFRRYGLAVVLVGVAAPVSHIGPADCRWAALAILVAAAGFSGWFGGQGPGLLATILLPVAWVNLAAGTLQWVELSFAMAAAGALSLIAAHFRLSLLQRWHRQAMQALPLWEQDRLFNQIMGSIQYTLVDRARCYMLYQMTRQISQIAGEVAEVGVYKGGTAKLLASSLPGKTVHLFDTFAGMPTTNANFDKHLAGEFSDTSLAAVQQHLRECGNVRFYQGLFPSTAGPIEGSTFSLVHVDADIYDSVRACCEFFYPRLEIGAVMVFDDYGFPTCPGARKAVDEFFRDKPEIPFYLQSGQCWIVRK